jgi:signal transduction histidine kinase
MTASFNGVFSPARQIQIFSMCAVVVCMFLTGTWLTDQTATRVIQPTVEINALYVASFVAPALQNLTSQPTMSLEEIAMMDHILSDTPLGSHIAASIVWDLEGRVLYSSDHSQIGQLYAMDPSLVKAYTGQVMWELTNAGDEEHTPDQTKSQKLLAVYNPIREAETGRVIAVVEFYQSGDALMSELAATQRQIWLVTGFATVLACLVLTLFARFSRIAIAQQQSVLDTRTAELTNLLTKNTQLLERIQQATYRTTTQNEQTLHYISNKLYNSLAQYLSAAILYVDQIAAYHEKNPESKVVEQINMVNLSLTQAMRETRSLAAGLAVPSVDKIPLNRVIDRVVSAHERRHNTNVAVITDKIPIDASLPIKVTLYRVVQEALAALQQRGHIVSQRIRLATSGTALLVEISARSIGRGSEDRAADLQQALVGMRDRAESLGGQLDVSAVGADDLRIDMSLPLYRTVSDG